MEPAAEPAAPSVVSLDEALARVGTGRFQAAALLATGLTWSGDAMELAVLAYVLPALQSEWGFSQAAADSSASAVFVGMLVGSLAWGVFCDQRGRRLGWLCTTAVTAVGGVLSAAVPAGSLGLFLAARALCGAGLSGTNLGFALSSELLPSASRGRLLMLYELFFVGGSALEVLLAWLALGQLGWRGVLLLSTVPLWSALALQRGVPESPRWLVGRGQPRAAAAVLDAGARANGRPPPLAHSERLAPSTASGACADGAPHGGPAGCALLGAPFHASLRVASCALCAAWFLASFVYFGAVLLTPKLIAAADANGGADGGAEVYVAALLTTLAELPGLLLATACVDRVGRVRTAAGGMAIAAGALGGLVALKSALKAAAPPPADAAALFTALTALCRMAAFGAFSSLYVLTAEVYPTRLRATAFGIVSACSRVAGALTPWVAGSLWEASAAAALLAYAAAAALCALLLGGFVREARGMHDELDEEEQTSLVRAAAAAAAQPPAAGPHQAATGRSTTVGGTA